ncbi:hypothetical protein SDC9_182321 [bioreactor metagenome]|uniref:Uncharacterized protein n=1 Tax=bioreactor metagenome TaxID=1076179 RepID=A0A645H714_9ZZZZ
MAVVAQVEGQKIRLVAGKPRRHEDQVLIHSKMHQCPLLELEDQFARIAILLVLLLGILHRLAGKRIFQLRRHQRQTVQEQDQIEAPGMRFAIEKLPGYGQPVLFDQIQRLRIHPVVRRKHRHAQLLAVTLEALTQDLEHALGVQLLDQMIEHHLARLGAMNRVQALPRLGLRHRDELQHQHRVQRPQPVVTISGRAFAVIDEAITAH